MQYTVTLNYIVSITKTVEAKDEGEAYTKARNLADEADLSEFNFVREIESNLQ